MTWTVQVTNPDGDVVFSAEVQAPSQDWLDQEHLTAIGGVLLSAGPERCPYDCERCREGVAEGDRDDDPFGRAP